MLRQFTPLALAVALSACTAHAPGTASGPPPNVILITIDTLRADRIDRELTPAIDSLAARGTRFTNARAAVPLTLPSHVSMMTGALPPQTGVRLNGQILAARPTIARVLRDAGYRTGAFVSAYVLDRRFGLADGFDIYDDRVARDPSGAPNLEAERRGDRTTDAAIAWLDASAAGAASADKDGRGRRPFFLWLHLYDPHAPYEPPSEYLLKAQGNAYDGEIAFADAQVARVLRWLEQNRLQERTVVAVAGDHGEGLGDHGEATHGMLLYDSTLRVPLVIAGPNAHPGASDRPVSLANLAPTLLMAAGQKPAAGMRQVSIFQPSGDDEIYAETEYPSSAGWHPLKGLVFEQWKLIASSESELYDVRSDPAEARNAAPARASLVDAARKRLSELGAVSAAPAAAVPSGAAERLRALGYVSGRAVAADDRAPNPAKQIAAWNSFEKELTRLTAGDARGALPGLERLARAFPDAPVFQSTYARALKDIGRARAAMDLYRRCVARWPNDASMYHDLAVAAQAAGDGNEAARAERAALALEPGNAAAANGLGLVQVSAGKTADAIASFEKAVAGDPSNAVYWTNLGNARRDADNVPGAEQAYRTALEHDPRSADAANGMGVLLVQAHRSREAIRWFDQALAGSPNFVEARLNLGIAWQESGNPDKASEQYRRVLTDAAPGSRESIAARNLLAQISRQ